jgi:DNA-binding winged helix-turn-helix (wHTH) protein
MSAAMTDTLFRFGHREVDITGREVRVDGQPRPIEPRPFDLLVYLIRQRHRVVPREELLAQVWPQEVVSLGALARAVMKARQALDDAGDPALIRTVPRVGYRFVAPLHGEAASASASGAPLRIALLPFDNATGDPALDWVRLGLMSLVARVLAHDGRVAPVPTQDLLATLEGQAAEPGASAAALRLATGARHVVSSRITRNALGYRLAFQLWGGERALQAEVQAAQPSELGRRMAQALLQQLCPGAAAAEAAALGFRDPMATEAFARGLQAAAEHKWPQAANLFRLVLELDPEHRAAQLELLRSLAPTGDAAGKALARRLLAQAERDNDMALAAQAHQALGRWHLNRGALGPAAYRLEAALRLAAGQLAPEWAAETLLLQSSVAVHLRQFDAARRSLDEMQRLCERSGQRLFPLAGLNMRALMASDSGDPDTAVQLSAEVVARARELRAHRYLVDACTNAMADLIELGRLNEAASFGEEGFATAVALDDWHRASGIAPTMGWLYRLARAPQALQRIVALLGEPDRLPRPDGAWTARAHLAACAGRHDDAARCLQRSVALLREARNAFHEHLALPWLVDALIRSGRTAEAEAELARASQPPYCDDKALAAQLLHARARLAHAAGEPDTALALLHELIDGPATALWRSWARIDAAWLHAEAGRGEQALRLLDALAGPLAEQPAAFAALARARFAHGDFAGALAAHHRYLEALGPGQGDDPFALLGRWYTEMAGGGLLRAAPLPPSPVLPCRP